MKFILLIMLVFFVWIIFSAWLVFITARNVITNLTEVLHKQKRMSIHELSRYCDAKEIKKLIKPNYLDVRIKESKRATENYWKVNL